MGSLNTCPGSGVLQRDTHLPETWKVRPYLPIPRIWSCYLACVSARVDDGPLESRTGHRSQPHVHRPSDTASTGSGGGDGLPPSPLVPRRAQTPWPPRRALSSPRQLASLQGESSGLDPSGVVSVCGL